ncbi:glycine/sarcosine/betaine reductase complex component C subunit alpha [Vagococcus elongatus]|uniref:Glycine reductase n=1 Tax=Vagococcus elongatus TaxID=180344 RepID=A0A430B600_9ENTE|nr:glycine/sarcosine/betaine reductase complex component C subunit alpha [Vagococcus elongatus]RSU15741.1 glycine reductase [Vagococcus elongatus]
MSNQVKKTIKKVFEEVATAIETGKMEDRIKIGLTIDGSELGFGVMKEAAYQIKKENMFDVVIIGSNQEWAEDFEHVSTTDCQKDAYAVMEEMLESGELQGCVTLHYNFPIGVSTVGKVLTPAFGREMLIATTTGTTSTLRNEAMVLNAINGIIAAKAIGIEMPKIGILNVDGAKTVERSLYSLKENGYDIHFGESARADGGSVLRGNDLLTGSADVVVTDSLTGNVLTKLFSSYSSGGTYEVLGSGYGPGIGANYDKNICIISRTSGAPVIANALEYAYQLAKGKLSEISRKEYQEAEKAGLKKICEELRLSSGPKEESVAAPEKQIVTEEISGIDVMELEDAVSVLWKENIYAESGMGCTGPVILVNEQWIESAEQLLKKEKFL